MTSRGVSMQRLPTAGRWSIYIALAVAFAIACAFLAVWQFDRNEERAGELALVAANYDAEVVPVGELLTGTDDFAPGDEWRPVSLRGEYLADDQVYVRNRPHGGTSAFEVLTPFLADDGRIFVIDRGWVRPAEEGSGPSATPPPPEGTVEVIVRLRPGEALPASGRGAPEGQVPTIHLPLIAERTGDATVVSSYGMLVSEEPATQARPTAIEAPTEDPGPHLSYAIQWILFAVMGFVFIAYVIRTEVAHRRESASDSRELPAPSRRDRDMEDEDALLDAASSAR